MKVLITAGPTREYLDPVRFISNPSTGKMGYIIAKECIKRGYEVILISGPTHINVPSGVKCINVETAEEMKQAVLRCFPQADVLIMSAAVSDWRPVKRAKEKIKRKKVWNLKLVPNPDILKEVAKIKKAHQKVIGFALETEEIIKNAKKKLKEKNMDIIVADTPAFFGEGKEADVVFIYRDGTTESFKKITKEAVAKHLISLLRFF
ncbi:MAG: phosphopantothenoylcysteine decarboxylase [Candidatus Ratteibacteria bacterium]|nr:phosphopantothenoylcysteine decarboxylase [Candidatus Ratteibacteria bacterium]